MDSRILNDDDMNPEDPIYQEEESKDDLPKIFNILGFYILGVLSSYVLFILAFFDERTSDCDKPLFLWVGLHNFLFVPVFIALFSLYRKASNKLEHVSNQIPSQETTEDPLGGAPSIPQVSHSISIHKAFKKKVYIKIAAFIVVVFWMIWVIRGVIDISVETSCRSSPIYISCAILSCGALFICFIFSLYFIYQRFFNPKTSTVSATQRDSSVAGNLSHSLINEESSESDGSVSHSSADFIGS